MEFGTEIEFRENEHMSRNDYPCSERYCKAAERRLPRFGYIDGSVVTECRIKQNDEELASLDPRQRMLSGALALMFEDG